MRFLLCSSALALVLALTAVACGGNSTTSPSGGSSSGGSGAPKCRRYATLTNFSGAVSGTTTCTTFNTAASTNQISCTVISAGTTSVQAYTYGSVAEFIDEVRVIPPLDRWRTIIATSSSAAGVTTMTGTYDAQNRMTLWRGVGPHTDLTITFTS